MGAVGKARAGGYEQPSPDTLHLLPCSLRVQTRQCRADAETEAELRFRQVRPRSCPCPEPRPCLPAAHGLQAIPGGSRSAAAAWFHPRGGRVQAASASASPAHAVPFRPPAAITAS